MFALNAEAAMSSRFLKEDGTAVVPARAAEVAAVEAAAAAAVVTKRARKYQ